jgi:DDE superfamily endonuclease
MEARLALYAEPYDPKRPKVNCDETSKQLRKETRAPVPPTPGQGTRYDYDYARNGTRTLFVVCEPQAGWRQRVVTTQRTLHDFAHQMKGLVDEGYPDAELIGVVLDTLNPHKRASWYEPFTPHEARRSAKKFEFPYTPKPGSWRNRAALDFSVAHRQC